MMRSLACCSLALTLVLAGCGRPLPTPAVNSFMSGAATTSLGQSGAKAFTVAVAATAAGARAGIESVMVDGHLSEFKSRQLILRLKNEAGLKRILKTYGARVIEQEELTMPALVRGRTGPASGTSMAPRKLPVFLLEVPEVSVDVRRITELGAKAGLKGHFEFASSAGAGLVQTMVTMQTAADPEIEAVGPNLLGRPTGMTTEGPGPGGAAPVQSPTDRAFWWAGVGGGGKFGANIQTPKQDIWQFGDGSGVKVAVIDGGFSSTTTMPASIVGAKSYWLYNAVRNNADISGPAAQGNNPWHGRQVASLIFAPHNDRVGTHGTAPGATALLAVTDYTGWTEQRAVDVAVAWGAQVINMSFVHYNNWLPPQTDPLWHAITSPVAKKVVFVGGAGNDGDGRATPSAYWEVMGVGAHDQSGKQSSWYGGKYRSNSWDVDIWAPGTDIAAAASDGDPDYEQTMQQGTSMAAPIVSGIAAICLQNGLITDTPSAIARFRSKGQVSGFSAGVALDALNTIQP